MAIRPEQGSKVLDLMAAKAPFAAVRGYLASQGVQVKKKTEVRQLLFELGRASGKR